MSYIKNCINPPIWFITNIELNKEDIYVWKI